MSFFARGELVGSYRIDREIGSGSSSNVYLSFLEAMPDQPVALKVRRRGHGPHEEILARRFFESSRLQYQFCHPNIASFHEYFEVDHFQIIAIEYLKGGTLQQLLKEVGGKVSVDVACLIGAHLADGLAHMHDLQVIHRDLKPDNVIFAETGDLSSVRIADFDVSKNPYNSPNLTEKGGHVGTLCYIAPEQFNQEKPRPTADIYSLGMIMFELITGQLPFESISASSIFTRFLDQRPLPTLSEFAPNIHPGLEWLIDRAIDTSPERRVPSAATFSIILLAISSWSRDRFDRTQAMRKLTHEVWLKDQLAGAPPLVRDSLVGPLQSLDLLL